MADISISQLELLKKQYSIEPDSGASRLSDRFNAFQEQGIDIRQPMEKFLLALEVERLTLLYRQIHEDHSETLKALEDLTLAARDDKSRPQIIKPETPEERVVIDRNSVEVMFENINIEALMSNFSEQGKQSDITSGILFLLSIEIERLTLMNTELKGQVMELEKKVGLDESQNLSSERHSVVYRYMEELEGKVNTLEEVKRENEALIVSLDTELREGKKEIEHLMEDRERLESMTSMLAHKQQSTAEERDQLAAELAELRMNFSNIRQELEGLHKENEELKEDLENLKPPPNFPGSPVNKRLISNLVSSQVDSEPDVNVDHYSKENSATHFRESLKLITESGFFEDASKKSNENNIVQLIPIQSQRIAELEELLKERDRQVSKLDELLSVPKLDKSISASRVASMVNKSMLARSTFSNHPYNTSAATSTDQVLELTKAPQMLDKSITVVDSETPIKLESERLKGAVLEEQLEKQALSLDTMCKNIMDLQQAVETKDTELEACLEELAKATEALVENQTVIHDLEAKLTQAQKNRQSTGQRPPVRESVGVQTIEANMHSVLQDENTRLRIRLDESERLKEQVKLLTKEKKEAVTEMESWKFETEVLKNTIEENEENLGNKEKENRMLKRKIEEFSEKIKGESLKAETIKDLNSKVIDLEKKLRKQESNNKFNDMLLNHSEMLNDSPPNKSKDQFRVDDPDSMNPTSSAVSMIQVANTTAMLSPSYLADANAVFDKHSKILTEINQNLFSRGKATSNTRADRLEAAFKSVKAEAEGYRLKLESCQALLAAKDANDACLSDNVYQVLYEQEKKAVKILQDELKRFDRIGRQKDDFIDQIMARSLRFYEEIENNYRIKEKFDKLINESNTNFVGGIVRRNTIQGYTRRESDRNIEYTSKNKKEMRIPVPDEIISDRIHGLTETHKSKFLPPKRITRSSHPSKVNLHDDFQLL